MSDFRWFVICMAVVCAAVLYYFVRILLLLVRKGEDRMKTVKLAIADGGFVADIEMPPFLKMPEVIVWGIRTFAHYTDDEYREVGSYFVPRDETGNPTMARKKE
jgi:hypothetical protein